MHLVKIAMIESYELLKRIFATKTLGLHMCLFWFLIFLPPFNANLQHAIVVKCLQKNCKQTYIKLWWRITPYYGHYHFVRNTTNYATKKNYGAWNPLKIFSNLLLEFIDYKVFGTKLYVLNIEYYILNTKY